MVFDLSGLDPLLAASARAEILVDGEVSNGGVGLPCPGNLGSLEERSLRRHINLDFEP